MKIGIVGPSHIPSLVPWLGDGHKIPSFYTFPLIGRLAAALRERGHEICVITTSQDILQPFLYQGDKVSVWLIPSRKKRAAYDFYQQERNGLSKAIQQSGCDLYHAHWCYEFASGVLESGRPYLVTCHDSPNEVYKYTRWTKAWFFWIRRCQLGRQNLRKSLFTSAVSPYVEKNIRLIAGSKPQCWTIPNGVPDDIFKAGHQRLSRKFPDNPFRVATVLEGFGNLKNASSALLGFSIFRAKFPTTELHMFGGGYGKGGEAEKWALSHGVNTGVYFHGFTPQAQLHSFLSDSIDVLLHPSLTESHPMAVVEAMALGVPVLGGQASGGVPWTLDEGRAGALTDVRDAGRIASSLEELALHPAKRSLLARAGWEHAHRYFREETMVDAYLRAYQEVLTQTALAANPSTVASG